MSKNQLNESISTNLSWFGDTPSGAITQSSISEIIHSQSNTDIDTEIEISDSQSYKSISTNLSFFGDTPFGAITQSSISENVQSQSNTDIDTEIVISDTPSGAITQSSISENLQSQSNTDIDTEIEISDCLSHKSISTNLSRNDNTPSGAFTPSSISEITQNPPITNTNNETNFILSVIWEHGFLSAAYYEISTMQLFVSPEVFDAKPNYQFLHNLFQQLNITEVIASGPLMFLKTVMKLCELPATHDIDQYRVKQPQTTVVSRSFVIVTNNEKTLESNRKRILKLNLPASASPTTFVKNDQCSKVQQEHEQKMFIETIIPIQQELVVQSLGNLLIYLDTNWCHLFLTNDPNPIISNYQIIALDKQVYIDDSTMLALQIFSPTERHPSGFKRGAEKEVKEGLSVFDIFDHCISKCGRHEMKMLFQQPTRNVDILTERYDMIEWCLKKSNKNRIILMKLYLKNVVNISEIYLRLIAKGYNTKVNDWIIFYECLMSIYQLYGLFNEIIVNEESSSSSSTDINDFICKLAMFRIIESDDEIDDDNDSDDGLATQNAVTILTRTFDIETSKKNNHFMVKCEFDPKLDEMKIKLKELQQQMEKIVNEKIAQLPNHLENISLEYINDFGYILGFQNDKNIEHNLLIGQFKQHQFEYMYTEKKKMVFKSLTMIDLNVEYTKLRTTIRYNEQLIAEAILDYLQPNIVKFQAYICLCAKLDCFIAMAAVASKYNLIRPQLTRKKVIDIINGRHILLEKISNTHKMDIITNDTLINCNEKNLITILTAPNSTGKSIYLKQTAIILFMTHIGSFVPAESATIGLIDAIYTRMNVIETIRHNTSSFLNEIQQLSKMLMSSTTHSFLIIDEFGQGTTTTEGKAFLCATVENLMERLDKAPITFISTHSIDIYDYIETNEWVRWKTIAIKRDADNMITSLYKIIEGRCPKVYAMDCAELKSAFKLIFEEQNCDSDDDDSRHASTSGKTSKTTLRSDSAVEEEKVRLAFNIFKMFVDNGFVDDDVVDRMLEEATA